MADYANPTVGAGHGNPQGIAPSANAPDTTRLWQEVHDRVMYALDSMPHDAAEKLAQGIAKGVVAMYQSELKKGRTPGESLETAMNWEQTWTTQAAKQNNVEIKPSVGQQGGGASPAPVSNENVKNAQQQYVDGITAGQKLREEVIAGAQAAPNARDTFRRIDPDEVANIDPAARLAASKQNMTKVGATDLTDLEATAAGQGAGQMSAAARYRQQMLRDSQTMNAAAAQARGNERAGARLAAISARGEAGVAGGAKIEELDAQTRIAAQSKIADIKKSRVELQANLDDARRANDATRAQEITLKMADLDRDEQKANAEIQKGNADRQLTADTSNNAGALAATKAGSEQDIAQADLRMRAQKALEDSAQGVLQEDSRQEAIKMARAQLDLSERAFKAARNDAERNAASQNRAFWTTTLTSLLATAATVVGGPAAGAAVAAGGQAVARAAHGGAVARSRIVEVGEAGRPEIIIPLKGTLSQRLARALEIEATPFDAEKTKDHGEIDSPDDLTRAIKATLKTFRAKQSAAPAADDDELGEMAAATLRHRRARGAR